MNDPGPAGPGAQNERTALSWQRTALALLTAAAIISRLTFDHLGPFVLTAVVVALPLTAWVVVASNRRYRHRASDAPLSPRTHSDGTLAASVTVVIVVLGLTEFVAIVIA